VEQIDQLLGQDNREKVSAGLVVKAMILNGLGFVSAPLYLFSRFFEGKATEHLIGAGVKPEHLNDDRLGRVLDGLFLAGLSSCFVSIAMKAITKFGVSIETAHLDSTSFHLHGEYETANDEVVVTQKSEDGTRVEIEVAPKAIHLTYGYSRDHRSDLKQFVMNLICGGEGGIPLFLEMADGNQDDKTKFGHLFEEFQKQWTFEGVHIAEGMVMGLCLLVYNLGQTALRQALVQADESLPNQLKKPTQRPTLRWIFQCFQAVHLLVIDGVKQIANLTDERLEILRFFSPACRDYYLLC
jgi:transposase